MLRSWSTLHFFLEIQDQEIAEFCEVLDRCATVFEAPFFFERACRDYQTANVEISCLCLALQ